MRKVSLLFVLLCIFSALVCVGTSQAAQEDAPQTRITVVAPGSGETVRHKVQKNCVFVFPDIDMEKVAYDRDSADLVITCPNTGRIILTDFFSSYADTNSVMIENKDGTQVSFYDFLSTLLGLNTGN